MKFTINDFGNMKGQVRSSFYLYLVLCICTPIFCYDLALSEEFIYKNLHMQQRLCGSVLSDTMRELCVEYNGLRTRRSITECCKEGCTYLYLMTYFCRVPRVNIDDLPGWAMSSTAGTVRPKVQNSAERLSQNNEFGQESLPNKIQKQAASEEVDHRPPEYGYVRSTRPPIIYSHSNTISRGAMRYQVPNQSRSNQQ